MTNLGFMVENSSSQSKNSEENHHGALAQLVGRGKRTFAPSQAPNHLLREQEIFGFAHLLSSRFAQPTGI